MRVSPINKILNNYWKSDSLTSGTAPVVPYMPTLARQLGFSSVVVGTMYTVLNIIGMISKPGFGAIADRFKRQKILFLIFQVSSFRPSLGLFTWVIHSIPVTDSCLLRDHVHPSNSTSLQGDVILQCEWSTVFEILSFTQWRSHQRMWSPKYQIICVKRYFPMWPQLWDERVSLDHDLWDVDSSLTLPRSEKGHIANNRRVVLGLSDGR